jgi:hypothetical protein
VSDSENSSASRTFQAPAQTSAALGFEPVLNTPEEFADRIKEDFEAWGKLIREDNLMPG